MYLILKERNGEYEYLYKSVHKLPNAKQTTMENFSRKYAKSFYGGNAEKTDDGFYFHNGEVCVEIYSYQEIHKAEYEVLNRYL